MLIVNTGQYGTTSANCQGFPNKGQHDTTAASCPRLPPASVITDFKQMIITSNHHPKMANTKSSE
jgi:hypothetical protein